MTLKFKKPVTPSQRGQIALDQSIINKKVISKKSSFAELPLFNNETKNLNNEGLNYTYLLDNILFQKFVEKQLEKKEKALKKGKMKKSGRNNQGRITVRHRGGGHKQSYRKIAFQRNNLPFQLMIYNFHQDPNRSANLAFLGPVLNMDYLEQAFLQKGKNKITENTHSTLYYQVIAPKNLEIGDKIKNEGQTLPKKIRGSAEKTNSKSNLRVENFFKEGMEASYMDNPQIGDSLTLQKLPLGAQIHNLEISPGKGGQLVRSAGAQAEIIEKSLEKGQVRIKLPSNNQRWIPMTCKGSLGAVGNEDHRHIVLGKAGASRWRGRRPKVRGVAMNPVDHPHGGGEGRTSGGRPSVTPWGRPTRSFRLKKKKINPFLIKVLLL